MGFKTIAQLVGISEEKRTTISSVVLDHEKEISGQSTEDLLGKMGKTWQVMKDSMEKGIEKPQIPMGGLVMGASSKIGAALKKGRLAGDRLTKTILRSLAVGEVNASMGLVAAAPTAGACGILPAVLFTAREEGGYGDDEIIKSLFTAAGIGLVIGRNASISGAEGGCQAECGTAAAMAAAALVELGGGSPKEVGEAAALSIKNVLGLVCDPVAGLVEVPCIKRNAFFALNAWAAAEMALAGIESVIPVDEVIGAMKEIGEEMPTKLKETSMGGLATTPTGKKIAREQRTGRE